MRRCSCTRRGGIAQCMRGPFAPAEAASRNACAGPSAPPRRHRATQPGRRATRGNSICAVTP